MRKIHDMIPRAKHTIAKEIYLTFVNTNTSKYTAYLSAKYEVDCISKYKVCCFKIHKSAPYSLQNIHSNKSGKVITCLHQLTKGAYN